MKKNVKLDFFTLTHVTSFKQILNSIILINHTYIGKDHDMVHIWDNENYRYQQLDTLEHQHICKKNQYIFIYLFV